MRIGIVGGGTVGRATARAFMEYAEIRVHDRVPELSTHSIETTLDSDVVFVCLPTPATATGAADVSAIVEFFRTATLPRGRSTNFVLRSTVPIGTTRMLSQDFDLPNLVHSPEFLTARCSIVDAQLPARSIIGYPRKGHRPFAPLGELYASRFPGVQTFYLSSDESELVKLAVNSFFAVKVAFFNEARALSDASDCDWDSVLTAVLADGRIAHSHTSVPGPDGKRGFGGACLPKDLADFACCCEAAGVRPRIALAALARNTEDRK